jgi:D-alanyl-D-alanine carboxypeptidase
MGFSERASRTLLASVLSFGLMAASLGTAMARPVASGDHEMEKAIDELLSSFKKDAPGGTVIAVKDGKVVYRKGYGMANLELGVANQPEMVFRLGSITKQFTAVAILMLADQGKLSITDEITKYLPDFPTQGHKITIEHLLTHTSGVKNYTALPEWLGLWRKDMSLTELIALFKDKPLDFAPGEKWSYSNSGYVLLGAIVEKASGESYQDFVEKRIFAPLGMKHSYYDTTAKIIPGRAEGYSRGKDGWANCAYLSMSQPHAAGSLASSVDDMAIWDASLYTEKLLKQEWLKKAWTSFKLNNGKLTNYGYGWGVSSYDGHRLIAHDGGINGFSTSGMRFPDDKVYVAVLTNTDSGDVGPDELALKASAIVLGKPYKEPVPVDVPAATLDQYVGSFKLDGGPEISVVRDGKNLFVTMGRKMELLPVSEGQFAVKGSMNRVKFAKGSDGHVTGLTLQTPMGLEMDAAKTEKPASSPDKPQGGAAFKADPAAYDNYVGEYEFEAGFSVTVSKKGDKLMGQATGQSEVEMSPESATRFVVKEVDAHAEFIFDSSGKVTSVVLEQGGQKMTGKKVK